MSPHRPSPSARASAQPVASPAHARQRRPDAERSGERNVRHQRRHQALCEEADDEIREYRLRLRH